MVPPALAGVRLPAQEGRPRNRVGVSLAGAEFGTERAGFSNRRPGRFGTDYTYNSLESVRYFADRGFDWVRLPIRWERLQPRLSAPLDVAELNRLKTFVGWARATRIRVVIDLHNYGRYHALGPDGTRAYVIDERVKGRTVVTRDDLADFWTRLAGVFRGDETVRSFGLMNEPHHMGGSSWSEISQHVVKAVRAAGDTRELLVAGDDWSSAERWVKANGDRAWITDPRRKVTYEAHCYFDHDGSGKYAGSFDAELKLDADLEDRGVNRVTPFLEWCRKNLVRGFVGEFGVPADPRWRPCLNGFLDRIGRAACEAAWWAAGEWWGEYPLSLQPVDFEKDVPQLDWILDRRRAAR